MTPNPSRELELFSQALPLAAAERGVFLDQACGSDTVLRQRVEALLRAHGEAGDFLEQAPTSPESAAVFAPAGEKPGDWIGRYKLLEQIGEGGCGVVYLAEQEEPVRRRVALKIIKPGMDTRSVIARFEAERQALALMDHPNIAKVFDAGSTASGRPYFVMELVRGTKITTYCDEHELPTEARLQLFIQICQAVQHAHQKGVIHRDLKPSNILVTTTESGTPSPVVIDFGIAKATTDQPLTDKTLFTAFEMLIGTPAYMSPEQAAASGVDVDTRTDIYSLGVLLYELLTGTTPFDAGELLKAGLDEVRRVIRERDPARPSARLGGMTREEQATVAHRRRAEPPGLIREVSGDLDWIAMKALEKDRTRRYETANGLASDVKRFLANETVSARPPSAGYRFRKTVARHKLLFAAAGSIALLLLASLGLIAASLAKERRARHEADMALRQSQTEAEKSQQVTRFLEEMLQGVGPSVARGRDTKLLREILDKAAVRVGHDLEAQTETQAELRTTIGRVYQQLGSYDQAEAMERSALAGYRKVFGNEHPHVATALGNLASVLLNADKLPEAEADYREALAMRRKLLGPRHPDTVQAMKDLGSLMRNAGRYDDADILMQETLGLQRQVLGRENLEVADTLYQLGRIRLQQTRYAEAEAMERESLAIRQKLLGPENPEVAFALNAIGTIQASRMETDTGLATLRQVLAMRRRLYGERHPQIAGSLAAIAQAYLWSGRYAEAEPAFRETIAMQRVTLGENHQDTLITLNNLATVVIALHNEPEAEAIYQDLFERSLTAMGRGHPNVAYTAGCIADLMLKQRKFAEADQVFARLLPPGQAFVPEDIHLYEQHTDYLAKRLRWREATASATQVVDFHPDDYLAYHSQAPLLAQLGDQAAFVRCCQTMLERFGKTDDPMVAERIAKDCGLLAVPGIDLAAVSRLADIAVTKGKGQDLWPLFAACKALTEYRLGHFALAIDFARQSLAGTPDPGVTGMAYSVLALAHLRLGHADEARTWLQQGTVAQNRDWPEADPLDSNWQSWIFAHVLLREATAAIPPNVP